jgi:6-phosphogluconolactonase
MNRVLVFSDLETLNIQLAQDMVSLLEDLLNSGQTDLTLAISGGNTPLGLFSFLADHHADSPIWSQISVYWVDERHVPFDHPESNYGNVRMYLEALGIPSSKIYPMGEDPDTKAAAMDYNELLQRIADKRPAPTPLFDLTLLGVGPDGHMASLFPGTDHSHDKGFCKAAIRPETGQARITMTLGALNRSRLCVFIASGASKAEIIKTILKKGPDPRFPASLIAPPQPPVWYLDQAAASLL